MILNSLDQWWRWWWWW